jgi:hypothetical protein
MLGGIDVVHNDARFAVFNNACKRCRIQRLSDALALLQPNSVLKEMPGDRSIDCTRVDVDKSELSCKLPRNAALPRGSGTINGDHTVLGSA